MGSEAARCLFDAASLGSGSTPPLWLTRHSPMAPTAGAVAGDDVARPAPYTCISTTSPGFTTLATAAALQLVRRMQPLDSLLPTWDGSGVPWMP